MAGATGFDPLEQQCWPPRLGAHCRAEEGGEGSSLCDARRVTPWPPGPFTRRVGGRRRGAWRENLQGPATNLRLHYDSAVSGEVRLAATRNAVVAFELHADSTSEHRRRRQYWFQGRPLHRDDMLNDCRSAVGTVSTDCGKYGLGQNNGGSIQADESITSWPPDGLAAVLPGRGQGRATSSGPRRGTRGRLVTREDCGSRRGLGRPMAEWLRQLSRAPHYARGLPPGLRYGPRLGSRWQRGVGRATSAPRSGYPQ